MSFPENPDDRGAEETPLPLGLMMNMAQDKRRIEAYARLTEAQRRHLIERATAVRSGEEMKELVEHMAELPDENKAGYL